MSKTFADKSFTKKHQFENDYERNLIIRREVAEARRRREIAKAKAMRREW